MKNNNSIYNFSNKYNIFIISSGRTGTRFFGKTMNRIINNCFSVHEPDVVSFGKEYKLLEKIKNFGIYNLFIGRTLGKTGIRNISQNYLSGKINLSVQENQIKKHRIKYYYNIAEDLVIESYSGWYGCISALNNIFKNLKIVIITRNPKNWIISSMNWEGVFGKIDLVDRLHLSRMNPKMIKDNKFIENWKNFGKFEKLCWTYKTYYETILEQTKGLDNVYFVKFEDIFIDKDRNKHFLDLLKFMTDYEDRKFNYDFDENILFNKIHKSKPHFHNYEMWTDKEKSNFKNILCDISIKLGYTI